jgi:hypothetical protein
MTLIKTTLSALAVAGGLTAAVLGAAPAIAEPPPPPAPALGEVPPPNAPPKTADFWDGEPVDVGWALGHMEERLLHHAVVEHQHRRRLTAPSR